MTLEAITDPPLNCDHLYWETYHGEGSVCETSDDMNIELWPYEPCKVDVDTDVIQTICLRIKCDLDESVLWDGRLEVIASCPTISSVKVHSDDTQTQQITSSTFATPVHNGYTILKATLPSGADCDQIIWVATSGSGCKEVTLEPYPGDPCSIKIPSNVITEEDKICLEIRCKNINTTLWNGELVVTADITSLCPPDSSGAGGGCSPCGCQKKNCGCNKNGDKQVQPENNFGMSQANQYANAFSASCGVVASGTETNAPSLATGNLSDSWETPQSGPLDVQPTLTYNSMLAIYNSPFGQGVSDYHSAKIIASGDDATIHDGQGNTYFYTGKDINGKYLAPGNSASALEELSGGGWKETPANGFAKHYDSDGLMEKIVNAAGDVWTLTHDVNGLLTAATAPTGRITTYSYDASNKIRTITDPANRVTTYTVDTSGHLTEIVRPDNTNIEMLYDSAHRLTTYIAPDAHRTTYTYNSSGKVTHIARPAGNNTTFTYSTGANTVTDPNGNITTLQFDSEGRQTKMITPSGATTEWVWGTDDLIATVHPSGTRNTVTYTTAFQSNTTTSNQFTDENNNHFNYHYDTNGKMTSVVDQAGHRHHADLRCQWQSHQALVDTLSNGPTTTVYDSVPVASRHMSTHWDNATPSSTTLLVTSLRKLIPQATTPHYTYDNAGRQETVINAHRFGHHLYS